MPDPSSASVVQVEEPSPCDGDADLVFDLAVLHSDLCGGSDISLVRKAAVLGSLSR